MLQILGIIEARIKSCLTNTGNIILIVCIINSIAIIFLCYQSCQNQKDTDKIIAKIEASKIEIKKKTDHRYFNLTRTLEGIHVVKVNTYNGEIK